MRGHKIESGVLSVITRDSSVASWSRADITARGLATVAAEIAAAANKSAEECALTFDGNGDFTTVVFGEIPAEA